jgi:rhodanese-related sulfurtransferase
MPVVEIEATELSKRLAGGEGIRLIDVRTPVEYRLVHAQGAELLPLQSLDEKAVHSLATANSPVALICKSGARARQAADRCAAAGMENVLLVRGGTDAWVSAGLPAERERGVMSLERQVRLIAGVMLIIFSILALAVHPLWALGTLFVGSGLAFAGATDWCGMALLLARMPWNQSSKHAHGASCTLR